MKNLVCALNFDHKGNPWMASGQDGQFLKLNRDGKVLGAVGNGMGVGTGQFTEASYWVFDPKDNLIAGDTSVGRVTVMSEVDSLRRARTRCRGRRRSLEAAVYLFHRDVARADRQQLAQFLLDRQRRGMAFMAFAGHEADQQGLARKRRRWACRLRPPSRC